MGDYSDEKFVSTLENMWSIKISIQDLRQFKPDLVQKIYFCFLKDCDANLEKINQLPYHVYETLQYPDECMGALRIATLATEIKKYFKLVFDDDSFMPADLFNPRPKKTRHYFAMIYDFLWFSEEYIPHVDEIDLQVWTLCESRDKMRGNVEKLQQQVKEKRADNAKCQVVKEQEIERLEIKTKELQECQEEKSALKTQLESINLVMANLAASIKEIELRVLEASKKKERLKGLVIQPSEEQEIKIREERVAEFKQDNQRKRDHLAELQQNVKDLGLTKETLDKFIGMLQEILQEISKQQSCQTSILQKSSQVAQIVEETEDQARQNLQLSEKLAAVDIKLQQMHRAWDLKRESIEEDMKEQKEGLEDMQRFLTEQDIVCHDLASELASIDSEIVLCNEKITSTNLMISNNYKKMLDALDGRHTDLQKVLVEVAECVELFGNAD